MSKIIYTADKYDRMSQGENPVHDYTVKIDSKSYRVRVCSRRGAEIRAEQLHELELERRRAEAIAQWDETHR